MKWLKTLFAKLRTAILGEPEISVMAQFTFTGWRDQRVDDRKLTDNFSLYELTRTDRAQFQAENRVLNDYQISKLTKLAELLEQVRIILGVPLIIHSAYRCPALNATLGSRDNSQHLRSEAADFVPKGLDLPMAFSTLRKAAKEGKIAFGQLIYEKAERSYGTVEWLHISLGAPFRTDGECGQALSMTDGKYHLIETIKVA